MATHPAHQPQRLAAPAPAHDQDADTEPRETNEQLHALCEAWSSWCRTRRFYGRPSLPASLLGKLSSRTAPASAQDGGPDAIASAQLAAFHLAVISQPADALDRRVFELHYRERVRNIKAVSTAMGISRSHWYRLVRDFRARAYTAACEIQEANEAESKSLAHGACIEQQAPLADDVKL